MKHYVIQFRRPDWDGWDTWPQYQYDTLEEAKAAFEALPDKHGCRLAEAYTVVRYKPIRKAAAHD